MSYQLMNGFGLGSSAKALDAAAAHLMSVGGGPGGLAGKVPGAIVPAGGALPEIIGAPLAVEFGAAVLAGGGAVALAEIIKKSAEAQQPGKGGLYSAPTYGTLDDDRRRLADLQAERDRLRAEISDAKAKEKLPGTADVANYQRQQRLEQIEGPIQALSRALDGIFHGLREDDRENRARPWTRPAGEMPLPPVRPGEIPREHDEEFGPPGPPPPAGIERRTFGAYLHAAAPIAAEGQMPAATPPPGFPTVDTSALKAAAAEATETGQHIASALSVTATPAVNMGPLQALVALLERAVALQGQLGAGSAGAARPGPSLASRARGGFTGNGSAIG